MKLSIFLKSREQDTQMNYGQCTYTQRYIHTDTCTHKHTCARTYTHKHICRIKVETQCLSHVLDCSSSSFSLHGLLSTAAPAAFTAAAGKCLQMFFLENRCFLLCIQVCLDSLSQTGHHLVFQYMPIVPTLGRLRQEDYLKVRCLGP